MENDSVSNETSYDYYDYDYDINESFSTFDWSELGPSLFVFSLTFILGIVGNVLILMAVFRHTHVKSSPVNVFLASLASADLLLILVCLPLKVAKLFSYTWTMGKFSCKLLYYMQSVCGICSVLNLTALSIERYYVIVHPLKAQYLCTISKAKKTIFVTWLSAFILAIPILMVQVHMEVGERITAYWCVRDFDSPIWWRMQELYFLIVILVIPTLVMGFSYGKIIAEICRVVKQRHKMTSGSRYKSSSTEDKKRNEQIEMANIKVSSEDEKEQEMLKKTSAQESPDIIMDVAEDSLQAGNTAETCPLSSVTGPKLDNETKQVIRMLISIVVTFVICWGPLLIFNVIHAFEVVGNYLIGVEKHLKSIFSLLAYSNSCLNPIIYGFMSKSFRQSFASELRACYCCFRAMNQGLEGQLQQPLHQQENANFRPINTTTQVQNGQQQRGGHSQNLKRHLEDRCRPHTITEDRLTSHTEVTIMAPSVLTPSGQTSTM